MAIRKIVSRSIGVDVIAAEDLANNSVTAAEISDGAVTVNKIGSGAVTTDKIGDAQVSVGKLASSLDLSSNTVTLPNESVTADKLNVGQIGGRRNLIINGAMQVAQRGTDFSVTNGVSAWAADRFQVYEDTNGSLDLDQVSESPADFTYSTKITVTSADTDLTTGQQSWVRQRIEGYNTAHLNWGTASAKTVTLSFWVRSSITGTFAGSINNSAGNRVYPYTYTISSADTWEHKTITIEGDTSGTWLTTNGVGCTVFWSLGMASNLQTTAGSWAASGARTATGETQLIATNGATFYITGVQLEVGTVATPFEHRSYGEELALCQRYFETSIGGGSVTGDYSTNGTATGSAYNGTSDFYSFKVEKRATPAITAYSYLTSTLQGASSITTIGYDSVGTTSGQNITVSALTKNTGFSWFINQGSLNGRVYYNFTADSEL